MKKRNKNQSSQYMQHLKIVPIFFYLASLMNLASILTIFGVVNVKSINDILQRNNPKSCLSSLNSSCLRSARNVRIVNGQTRSLLQNYSSSICRIFLNETRAHNISGNLKLKDLFFNFSLHSHDFILDLIKSI